MLNSFLKLSTRYIYALSIAMVFFFGTPFGANAATMSLSPSSSTVATDNIVTIKVNIDTLGKFINNAEGTITFPSDLLQVLSVSKSSSIFSLWVEEPSFSNNAGTVTFNGGVANPGFNGRSGTVASITFKAKKGGVASVVFTDAAVRENDGLGTNILTSKNGSTISIGAAKPVEVPTVPPVTNTSGVPAKPVITSATHPDQNTWYGSKTASFGWVIPTGVTSIQTLFNKTSDSAPTISYDSSVTQKTITDLSDGLYYFHLRYANNAGNSSVAHYAIKIDTTPPDTFVPSVRTEGKRSVVTLNAQDVTSGVEYYGIQIDAGKVLRVKKDQLVNNEYTLPFETEGAHTLVATAYDKAGNHTDAGITFVSPAITTPEITLNEKEVKTGDTLTLSGTTDYPNTPVEIVVESNGKELKRYTQITSADGTFSLVTDKFEHDGSVSVSARMVLGEMVQGPFSEKMFTNVNETRLTMVTFAVAQLFIAVIFLLALLIALYIGWHKFFGLKRKLNRELQHAAEDVHDTVVSFKEELANQLESLEKIKEDRVLNKKEEAVFNKIKKNIDDIDSFIEKKLKKLM